MTNIIDKIKQLPDGGELALQPPYIPVYICVSELKALVSELDRKTRALENLITEFEHYRILSDPDEAEVAKIIQEARDAIKSRD